ncbi:putative cofD-like protein [Caldicoprobacter guelmensis]|uniref:gluconeogenesis factor YvcK family protein n=1 Tax=Caldicoprobacter guelmensis TaxID=1170224 RepID=UPI001FAF18E8|nr:gluconeogenesis factor YvcK family protein [Caldicoprobacter guelmensis]MBM7581553.1 putative cofD-like protein [Caldicoprobacter guelmensis]
MELIAGIAIGVVVGSGLARVFKLLKLAQPSSKKTEQPPRRKNGLSKGPKVVAIGGGTGLSTLLRGLKLYTSNITAVVTVADDGGSSGMLREDLGILPPGDIRNCILALADVEPIMEQLLQYRFKEGSLKGQNLGNLLIAAMVDIAGGFVNAIKEVSSVLAVTGRVLPVSLENVHLVALLEDGTVIHGESKIPQEQMRKNSPIKEILMDNPDCKALPEVIEAIKDADVVVLGPGSLYTSIIPNLIVKDVAQALQQSQALKIYVCNVMTQPGETTGYSVVDHVNAIIKHSGANIIDLVLVNRSNFPDELLKKYKLEGAVPVDCSDIHKLRDMGIKYVQADLSDFSSGLIRHHPQKLAHEVIRLAQEAVKS